MIVSLSFTLSSLAPSKFAEMLLAFCTQIAQGFQEFESTLIFQLYDLISQHYAFVLSGFWTPYLSVWRTCPRAFYVKLPSFGEVLVEFEAAVAMFLIKGMLARCPVTKWRRLRGDEANVEEAAASLSR